MFGGGMPSLPSKSLPTNGARPTPGGGSSRPTPSATPFNPFAGGMPSRKLFLVTHHLLQSARYLFIIFYFIFF